MTYAFSAYREVLSVSLDERLFTFSSTRLNLFNIQSVNIRWNAQHHPSYVYHHLGPP